MENVTVIRSKWVFGDANTWCIISATGMTFSYSNVESEIVPVGFTLKHIGVNGSPSVRCTGLY